MSWDNDSMFMWIIVIVMAVAVATEIVALVGMGLVALRAVRYTTAAKREITEKLQPSIQMAKYLAPLHRRDYERVRRDSAEIGKILDSNLRRIGAMWQDTNQRMQRLRLRFQRESAPRVRRLRRDRHLVSRGILEPIRTLSTVGMGVRSTAWLLRKVA